MTSQIGFESNVWIASPTLVRIDEYVNGMTLIPVHDALVVEDRISELIQTHSVQRESLRSIPQERFSLGSSTVTRRCRKRFRTEYTNGTNFRARGRLSRSTSRDGIVPVVALHQRRTHVTAQFLDRTRHPQGSKFESILVREVTKNIPSSRVGRQKWSKDVV